MLHAKDPVLPFCWSIVVMPNGQRVQKDAPETANVDVGHSAQIALPNVPDAVPAGHCVQFHAPRIGAKNPGVQATHVAEASAPISSDDVPESHSVQVKAPAFAYEPAPQVTQPPAFIVPGKVTFPAKPAAQMVHEATVSLPPCGVDMPRAHALQLIVPPFALPKYPGAHRVHSAIELLAGPTVVVALGQLRQITESAAENEPTSQAEHPAAFTVPGSVTSPAYPGAQIVHDCTDVAPAAAPAVNTPAGHKVQRRASRPEYEPVAHGEHPAALVVPPFVTTPKYPAAQTVHDKMEALAAAGVEMPAGHGMQPAACGVPGFVTLPK